jgi:hypothetical protein
MKVQISRLPGAVERFVQELGACATRCAAQRRERARRVDAESRRNFAAISPRDD